MFNPRLLLLAPFHRRGNQGTQRLNNLPRVKQRTQNGIVFVDPKSEILTFVNYKINWSPAEMGPESPLGSKLCLDIVLCAV